MENSIESIFSGISHSKACRRLTDEFQKYKHVHVQRIETIYHPGVPDLNVCIQGVEWWIEVKVKRDTLSDIQRLWITLRVKCGGRVAFVKFTKSGEIAVMDLTRELDLTKFPIILGNVKEVVEYFLQESTYPGAIENVIKSS